MSYQTLSKAFDKGLRSYSFCHVKRQSDVLGRWVGKNIFIMTFCVTNWLQREFHFKKIYIINKSEKIQRMHICFPFHYSTRTVFKFCFYNQSVEKGSQFTLLWFTTSSKQKKKIRHMCIGAASK